MKGFLDQVAADLYGKYGDGLSSLHIMFPSRRAGLFFGEALSGLIERPLWQPASITIDRLAEELSGGLSVGDRLRLITELYKVYAEFHPDETFDGFYFWGELLIGDFDSIDKYLIDADTLFSNLVDLHELDNRFDYLSDEQKEVVKNFWGTFRREGVMSPEQTDFLNVWRTLAPVYHRFRVRLLGLGIAYQGMVYRRAAENIRAGRAPEVPERHYVIAGFNALSRAEQVIFEHLQKNFKTDFYWDYDEYYTGDTPLARAQEAGRFMRDNLRRFPPASPLSDGHNNFARPKRIRSVSAGSDVLQCKYAGLRLAESARTKSAAGDAECAGNAECTESAVGTKVPCSSGVKAPGRETAIVLADESLLTPLLWSMPPEVEAINITMGYPLRMHPAYTFLERLIELQNRRRTSRNSLAFYHSDVEGLLRHPYLAGANTGTRGDAGLGGYVTGRSQYVYISAAHLRATPLLEKVFSAPGDGWRAMSDYLTRIVSEVAKLASPATEVAREGKNTGGIDIPTFALIVDHIRTLGNSLTECDIEILPKTYNSLLRRSLQSVTIPFEGEPLEGVQVMGILETRALDFENIIFLSSGDSTMPGNLLGSPSFIPYNLKMAYGLPTPEHHEGVWAYHFFRLIQRARNIEMVWSSTTDDRNTGEPSRYILQLDYESPHTVEKDTVTVDVNLSPTEAIVVEKTDTVMAKLGEFRCGETNMAARTLSPSMFFTYVECPLKFYFRAVARLRPDDELSEEVDNALFGNILHLAMQRLYAPLKGLRDPRRKIGELTGTEAVEAAVTEAVTELYTREENARPEDWGGSIVLIHKTITDYINRNILPFDASCLEVYTIENLEAELSARFEGVCFRGIADRIDRLADGTLRVIDYKTGSPKTQNRDNERFTSIEALFAGGTNERISAVLQTLLYAMMLREGDDGVGREGGEKENSGGENSGTESRASNKETAGTQKPGQAQKVQPALYYIRNLAKEGYSPLILDAGGGCEVEDYAEYAPEFEDRLRETLKELFDPAKPFVQCTDPVPCAWCDFNTICRR